MTEYYDPQMYGTETWWRHPIGNFLFTDSIKLFAEEHEAWWTVDVVGSYMNTFNDFDFLLLAFDVEDGSCTFTAREDTGMEPLVRQEIPFTDLTVSVQLYLERGDGYLVLMFPSDH